jgi:hypothetical protein
MHRHAAATDENATEIFAASGPSICDDCLRLRDARLCASDRLLLRCALCWSTFLSAHGRTAANCGTDIRSQLAWAFRSQLAWTCREEASRRVLASCENVQHLATRIPTGASRCNAPPRIHGTHSLDTQTSVAKAQDVTGSMASSSPTQNVGRDELLHEVGNVNCHMQ